MLKYLQHRSLHISLQKSAFRRVVLGISGGVDSAVSAYLLKLKGYEVIGAFMRNWDEKDETGICTADREAEIANWVCKKLDIRFTEVNFVKEYWNTVFSYLIDEYENGNTPNPDILCNKHIKFDNFFKYACEKFNTEAVATGHYARTSFGDYLEYYKENDEVRLLQAFDNRKDQTFFLSQAPQHALRRTMFPLGKLLKSKVRKIAREAGLDLVADKEDSTGICFIGDRNFQSFIPQYIEDCHGPFINLDTGQVVGNHRGFHYWTLGQCCKLGGKATRYFVASKDIKTNAIYVVNHTMHPALFGDSMYVAPFHWIHSSYEKIMQSKQRIDCEFRFQHGNPLTRSTVTHSDYGCHIKLYHPLRALTSGQFAVIYSQGECMGSAPIIKLGPSLYDLSKRNSDAKHHTTNISH